MEDFDGVGVWLDDFDEYTSGIDELVRYRELAESIGSRLWLMYGGYFSLMLARTNATEVSHGIFYTESKAIQGPVGSGPAAERYYVPRLHRFYEPGRALRAIEAIPELACACEECPSVAFLRAELVAASPGSGRRVAWAQRLQRHFLSARRREVDFINESSPDEITAELEAAAATIAGASPSTRAGLGIDTKHIVRWVAAT